MTRPSSLSPLQQWQGLCRNMGTWVGNMCTYTPQGAVQSCEPTILFIYTDSPTEPPYTIRMRLHRIESKKDAYELYLQGQDFRSMVYEPESGAFCSGRLNWTGGTVEMGLNWPLDRVEKRVRAVVTLSAEGMYRMALFRERRGESDANAKYPQIQIHEDALDNPDEDYVDDVKTNVEQLVGEWRSKTTIFGNGECAQEEQVVHRTIQQERVDVSDGTRGSTGIIAKDGHVTWHDGKRTVFLHGGIAVTTGCSFVRLSWWTGCGWLSVCSNGAQIRFGQEWRQ